MNIQVLGTGCYKCIELETLLADLLQQMAMPGVAVERISDPHAIRRIMSEDLLPGLLIDGVLVSSGRLPSRAEVRTWLAQAAQYRARQVAAGRT